MKGCPSADCHTAGFSGPYLAAQNLSSILSVPRCSGHQLDKTLSCLCVPFTWTQKPFTFPPLLKAYCEERSEFGSFYSPLQRSGFLLLLEVAHTLHVHKRDRLSALPLHQGSAEHIIYLPFLPQSHLELNLMCFISDSA